MPRCHLIRSNCPHVGVIHKKNLFEMLVDESKKNAVPRHAALNNAVGVEVIKRFPREDGGAAWLQSQTSFPDELHNSLVACAIGKTAFVGICNDCGYATNLSSLEILIDRNI
jgi:hypothetical protein